MFKIALHFSHDYLFKKPYMIRNKNVFDRFCPFVIILYPYEKFFLQFLMSVLMLSFGATSHQHKCRVWQVAQRIPVLTIP